MSIRTYCVIPHSARADTQFFQGVFEDGLRVLYQGRLHSLLFSHVLSPAHDYVKHINGPLLAALREGGNATLILATPNSEVPIASSTSSSTTAAAQGSGKAEDMAEVTPTVMELYAQLFPLLFRSVEGCATARVSAVTVSATERVLLDNLQGDRRLRSIGEAHQLVLHRHTSATQWGTLLRLLEDRHVAIEDSATALEGQTACVVTVELADYGRLVVVDTASSQELLQQLTLILGMEAADGEGRTYPPQTPLRDLLKHSTPAEAVVQVVCLPAPRETVRQTMRVLHFGSAIETWRSRGARGRSSSNQELSALHTSFSAGSGTGARPKHFTRPAAAASPSVSFEMDSAGHQRGADASHTQRHAGIGPRNTADDATPLHSPESSDESGGDHDGGRGGRGSSSSSTASQPQRYVPSTESSGAALRRDTVLHHGATPEHLPPSTVDRAAAVRDHEKEEQLHRQVRSLEARLADMTRGEAALQMERDDAVREKERVQLALRSKESMWADLQRAHNKAKQENADYAQLVDKLLKQVRVMERDTSRQKQQDMSVVRQLRQTREEKAELEAQVTRLRKEVMLFRREATYRAREATLSRIVPSDISVPAPQSRAALLRSGATSRSSSALAGTARVDASLISSSSVAPPRRGRRPSPRARRLYDSSSSADGANEGEDAAATKNPANSILDSPAVQHSAHPPDAAPAQSRRVTDITVEELRWRNRHLEEEVNRLQERLLRALASENRAAAATAANHSTPSAVGATCPSCDNMRERAEYFSAELAHVREEKDSLLDLVKSSNSSKVVSAKKVRFPKKEEEEAEEGKASDASAAAEEEEEEGTSSRKDKRSLSAVTRHVAGATHDVVAALLTGCASLQSQLASAQAVLDRRLHHATHTDPLSHVSLRVLLEHREAVAALSESLRCVADKPATVASPYASPSTLANQSAVIDGNTSSPPQQRVCLPPVPRCATAGNVEVLTGHLAFEAERCRHLRAFLPTFAQLAVATEHLLMRLEATEPES